MNSAPVHICCRRSVPAVFPPFIVLFLILVVAARAQSVDPVIYVRTVAVQGNEKTKEEVILREMMLRSGEPMTAELVEQDRERIYNLQLFNRVDIGSQVEGDSADLVVTVDERWYFYPFPVISVRHRDFGKIVWGVGVVHSNLGGLNQKLFAEAGTGYDSWVQLRYANPRFLGTADYYFGLETGYFHLHPLALDGSEFQQERWSTKLSLGKRFGFYQRLVATAGVESWKAPSSLVTRRTASDDGRDVFGTFSVQYIDDRRYLREYPMSGSFLMVDLGKDGFGESQMNIVRLAADGRQYIPLWPDVSLAIRGYVNLTNGGIVPSYRHVFYGYEERIRGEFSTVREGEGMAGGNLEVRFSIFEPRYYEATSIPIQQFRMLRYGLYGAVYAEGGKIWYRNQSPVDVAPRAGYGFGLHGILPYGLVARLDAGVSISGFSQIIFDAGASF